MSACPSSEPLLQGRTDPKKIRSSPTPSKGGSDPGVQAFLDEQYLPQLYEPRSA